MIRAVWATFYHNSSDDKNPQHEFCPEGSESWCKWRRAETNGTLVEFHHKPPLDEKILKAIKPIYEDLSSRTLLEHCLGGFTQNNNESFNSTVWKLAPKHFHSGPQIINIASYLATIIFNEGFFPILKVLELMGVKIGLQAKAFCEYRNRMRIMIAEKRHSSATREKRSAQKKRKSLSAEQYEELEGLIYGPGIAD